MSWIVIQDAVVLLCRLCDTVRLVRTLSRTRFFLRHVRVVDALLASYRYLDLLTSYVSLYNTLMKMFFIGSSAYVLYLMKYRYRQVELSLRDPTPELTSGQQAHS